MHFWITELLNGIIHKERNDLRHDLRHNIANKCEYPGITTAN